MNGKHVSRRKPLAVASLVLLVTLLHLAAPTDSASWHAVHLLAQQLYYVPLLLAGAWLGMKGAVATVAGVSVLYFLHTLLPHGGGVDPVEVGEHRHATTPS
jgi:hypothetical protein